MEIPTVVVNVIQPGFPPIKTLMNCTVLNSGSAISMDPDCNITVKEPTTIRFVYKSANGVAYHPVGISFIGVNNTDPTGATNFTRRTVEYDELVVRANDITHGAVWRYHLWFQNDNAIMSGGGDGQPKIKNQ